MGAFLFPSSGYFAQTEEEMSIKAKRPIRRLSLLFLLILALPAAYVLSIGPVVFIWHTFSLSDKGPVAEVVFPLYRPLERIPDDTAMKKALNFYVRLWDPRE